jgi:hypothetical protein
VFSGDFRSEIVGFAIKYSSSTFRRGLFLVRFLVLSIMMTSTKLTVKLNSAVVSMKTELRISSLRITIVTNSATRFISQNS